MSGETTPTVEAGGSGWKLAGDELTLTNSLGTKEAMAMVGDSPAAAVEGGEG